MKTGRISKEHVLLVQLIVVVALVASWASASTVTRQQVLREVGGPRYSPVVAVPRETPLVIEPFYDDPEVVSDEELAAVLAKIRPKFSREKLKSNHVEHAMRTWWLNAKFHDPKVMSGEAMKDYLVDHGQFLASWGDKVKPILQDRTDGVAIRWGKEECASIHHDHWLASLTEAGINLHDPVFTPSRRREIADVLQEALRDFRLDEVEVEWSALAFGLWIAPQKTWTTRAGRELSFDLLAERLMRGHKKFGVCSGLHRVYSLMVLVRLDDDHDILSDAMREQVMEHLRSVRDLMMVSQFPDGHWPSNWSEGADSVAKPINDELYKQVIATGHQLEWLAIAPKELHPPREQILKAADWVIKTTTEQSDS
ncbi:MAG: hypothetical protein H7062_22825, partial [Candidatus Saccharimonas sp.]|nr:hypothetical protein [Planctomycetaceae bacterium]